MSSNSRRGSKDTNNPKKANDSSGVTDPNDTEDVRDANDTDQFNESKKADSVNEEKDKNAEKNAKRSSVIIAESSHSLASLKQELNEFRTRESINSEHTQELYPGTYRSEYDYIAERHNPFATNLLEATSYLIKGCLGVGVLSMHEAFMYGGMVGSGIGAAAIGILISHCMNILVRSAQRMYLVIHVPRLTYPDLVEAAVATGPFKKLRKYSKNVRYILELFLFLETSGSCSLYEIVIANTIKKEVEYLSDSIKEMQVPLRAYIFIIMFPLMILCVIRKWKYLAPFSIIADLFVAICVITTMFYSMSVADNIQNRSLWKSVPGLFRFSGICLYAMDGIPVVLPIENNMRSPHHVHFIVNTGMRIVFVLTTSAGFLGYWGWGEQCKSPVTIHMPLETIPMILQFLLATMLAMTFAIQFWVPFKIIWHYIGRRNTNDVQSRYSAERCFRVLLLFLITCFSAVFPQSNNLMIFFGVTFISFNSLVFPTLIETSVFWRDHRPGKIRWNLFKNVFICMLGVTFFVGGLYSLYSP